MSTQSITVTLLRSVDLSDLIFFDTNGFCVTNLTAHGIDKLDTVLSYRHSVSIDRCRP